MIYVIKTGDTLSAIARAHGLTLARLLEMNPQYKGLENRIRAGARLALPDQESSGVESTAAPAPKPPAPPGPWLGELSGRYETGGRGPSTVSSGKGDQGGVSYGSYQMSSKPDGGTVARFLTAPEFPYPGAFGSLQPGAEAFTAQWKALVAQDAERFAAAEHAFIHRTHFAALSSRIFTATGLDVTTRSAALQNVVWSVAVQHGPATSLVAKALKDTLAKGDDGSDSDVTLINAIYEERLRCQPDGALCYFAGNSTAVQQGVRQRFVQERRDALQWYEKEMQQTKLS